MQELDGKQITPDDLFKMAQYDVVISHALAAWRTGKATWEQVLMVAVMHLSKQVRRLEQFNLELMQRLPPEPIKYMPGVISIPSDKP